MYIYIHTEPAIWCCSGGALTNQRFDWATRHCHTADANLPNPVLTWAPLWVAVPKFGIIPHPWPASRSAGPSSSLSRALETGGTHSVPTRPPWAEDSD